MEYYNNVLCFEAGWLIDNDIVSKSNYDKLTKRNKLQVVRRACRNTPALVAYDSMPDRFKATIKDKIGSDPYKVSEINLLEEYIEHSSEASRFFNEEFKLSDGRFLPKNTRNEYYTNAILLNAIQTLILDKISTKKAKRQKTTGYWKQISEAVQNLDRLKYPHSLPDNHESLKRKYDKYIAKEGGYISLIHKNFLKDTSNAAKINDAVKESFLIELLADPRNLDNERIARLYNEIAGQMNWRKISGHAVAKYRDKYDLEIYAGRRGSVEFYNKKAMQVKRYAPTKPLFYWTLDGWDVELLYQKQGEKSITYHNRPTVVVVLDPCKKYPIGYAIGTHETPELIREALKNAAQHTAQLFGKMYRSNQIQSDRYAFKTLEPLYAAMGVKVTPARAKNAKSKVIEPRFGYLNTEYCQLMPNWSGFGIQSDKESQPNNEFLNKYKKNFPDYEGVCMQVAMIIEKERQRHRDEYLQLWSETDDADKVELSYESYLYHFGESTGRKNLLQGDGLNVTIKGIRQTFDCFDLNFRKHASTQWNILYDPADTTRILAMNDDQTLRFVLEKKHIQPMALKDRKEGDADELTRVNHFNKELVSHVTEFRKETGETVREFLDENQQLSLTLAKLLLTDSMGQHKDTRNIEAGRRKAIDHTPDEISVQPVIDVLDMY